MDTDITKPNKQPFSGGQPSANNTQTSFSAPTGGTQNPFSTVPEQPTPEPNPPLATPEKPKKKSSALILLLILLTLCGVGFGVYGMFFKEPKTITKTIPCECYCEIDQAAVEENFVKIDDWNLGLKLPENLKNVAFVIGENGAVHLTGIKSDSELTDLPDFAIIDKNPSGLAAISRIPIADTAEMEDGSTLIYQDDEYKYYYSLSQAAFSTTEEEQTLEAETRALFGEVLSNPESFQKLTSEN